MRTLFGAVAGALALGAVVVSYSLGEQHTFSRDAAMAAGYQQMANPYLVQAGQAGYVAPYAPYATPYAAQTPYGVMTPAGYVPSQPVPQYTNQRVVTSQPVARRTVSQRTYSREEVAPKRTWQKSALLIGGSAAGGAGVGALIGGKKGAGIGALIGGGSAAIYDQVKRH
ncbi:MAG TPA: hypothetical protein VL243_05630 [Vicinamibacterales bacterium]|nr:hypothetical protein [Vicinamibacterales bacterium]